jgi:hypothetical protein
LIQGFADEHALILYVYLANYEDAADESVLTVGHSSGSLESANPSSITSPHSVYDHG